MKQCPDCCRNLPDDRFYNWKTPEHRCRSCYREGINTQKLRKAKTENPEKALRIEAYRQKFIDRGPCPEGHHWCWGCEQHLPASGWADSQIRKGQWCRKCASRHSVVRTVRLKQKAIAHLGGCCSRCGWTGHNAGFDFHHPDPSSKKIGWGGSGLRKWSWERILPRLEEVVLVCRNCHAIIHSILLDDESENPEYVPGQRRPENPTNQGPGSRLR